MGERWGRYGEIRGDTGRYRGEGTSVRLTSDTPRATNWSSPPAASSAPAAASPCHRIVIFGYCVRPPLEAREEVEAEATCSSTPPASCSRCRS